VLHAVVEPAARLALPFFGRSMLIALSRSFEVVNSRLAYRNGGSRGRPTSLLACRWRGVWGFGGGQKVVEDVAVVPALMERGGSRRMPPDGGPGCKRVLLGLIDGLPHGRWDDLPSFGSLQGFIAATHAARSRLVADGEAFAGTNFACLVCSGAPPSGPSFLHRESSLRLVPVRI
jgi:hypothetical protein